MKLIPNQVRTPLKNRREEETLVFVLSEELTLDRTSKREVEVFQARAFLNRHPEANAVTCCALEKINLREQGKAYMYDLRPIFEVYLGAM